MTYICCPRCGQKLIYGVNGDEINAKCNKCKTEITASFNDLKSIIVIRTSDNKIQMKNNFKTI